MRRLKLLARKYQVIKTSIREFTRKLADKAHNILFLIDYFWVSWAWEGSKGAQREERRVEDLLKLLLIQAFNKVIIYQ